MDRQYRIIETSATLNKIPTPDSLILTKKIESAIIPSEVEGVHVQYAYNDPDYQVAGHLDIEGESQALDEMNPNIDWVSLFCLSPKAFVSKAKYYFKQGWNTSENTGQKTDIETKKAEKLLKMAMSVFRRHEISTFVSLMTGKNVKIAGLDKAPVDIDWHMPAENLIELTGADQWTLETAKIIDNISTAKNLVTGNGGSKVCAFYRQKAANLIYNWLNKLPFYTSDRLREGFDFADNGSIPTGWLGINWIQADHFYHLAGVKTYFLNEKFAVFMPDDPSECWRILLAINTINGQFGFGGQQIPKDTKPRGFDLEGELNKIFALTFAARCVSLKYTV